MVPSRAAFVLLFCLGAACRRHPPTPPPAAAKGPAAPAPTVSCPTIEALTALVAAPGRTLRLDCIPFSPSYFWAAAALDYDPKGATPPPHLSFITGGPSLPTLAFDVDPGPMEAVARLVGQSRHVDVRIRAGRSRQHLVRLGVIGRRDDGPDSDEVAVLVQLIAHSAPRIVWAGPADQTRTGADGCITEHALDFEVPFHRDLEVFSVTRVRPLAAGRTCPPAGPGTQESVPLRGPPMRPPRTLAAAAPARPNR